MKSRKMVSTIDILPTILDATGIAPAGKMHGKSLRPVLKTADAPWREYLVAEFHFHGGRPFYPRRAIHDQRYKLIHNLLTGKSKPSNTIDADPAYRVSQQSRYDGTPVRRAFETFANPPEFELYDLENDAVEFNNLAGKAKYQAIQKRLTKALLEYRRQTDDPFHTHGRIVIRHKFSHPRNPSLHTRTVIPQSISIAVLSASSLKSKSA